MSAPKVIFNSSLPRAGSTLLQNILAQNPRFHCSPTSGVLDMLLAARTIYTSTAEFKAQDASETKKAFLAFCAAALPAYYAGITNKPVAVDKGRAWFHYHDWITQFYSNPKYLVCIRDLRSILSSMEKLFRKNRHLADEQDLPNSVAMVTPRNRLIHWLNAPPVGLAVLRLLEAHDTGVIKQLHIVRFEDLTTNPNATLQKIYAYLDEPHFSHDFNNVVQATRENDAFHTFYGDHSIRAAVQPVPLDYNQILGQELADTVRANNLQFYKTFYPDKH